MKKSLLIALSVVTRVAMVGCNSTEKTAKAPVASEVAVQVETAQVEEPQAVVTQTVTGSVGYRERIALPPTAVITVTLADVSLADAPSKTISEQTFKAADKSSPFNYALDFKTADIKANHRYSVRATIMVDGKLRFTTDTNYAVITDQEKTMTQDLLLKGVRQ